MKRIKPVIHEPSINRIIGSELSLILHDKANLIDAVNEVDKIIKSKGASQCQIMEVSFTWSTIRLKTDSINK